MDLLELAQIVEEKSDIDTIRDVLVAGLAPLGFRHLIYITVDTEFKAPFLICTVPDLYRATSPAADPFLHWCCNSYEPTRTGAEFLDEHDYLPETARRHILRAEKFGFRAGIGIPARLNGSERFGGFNLGTGLSREAFCQRILPRADELRLLCLLAHRRIEEVAGGLEDHAPGFRTLMVAPENRKVLEELTPREREVLFLIAQGLSRKECAQMCNITVNTVSEYAKSAYRKLGIRNRAEAAALLSSRASPGG